jgi:hypothetical protein
MHCNICNVFYSQCYHQLASAGILAVIRVILLQECKRTKLVKCVTNPTKFGVCILVTKKEHHPEDGRIASRIMLVRTLFIKYVTLFIKYVTLFIKCHIVHKICHIVHKICHIVHKICHIVHKICHIVHKICHKD